MECSHLRLRPTLFLTFIAALHVVGHSFTIPQIFTEGRVITKGRRGTCTLFVHGEELPVEEEDGGSSNNKIDAFLGKEAAASTEELPVEEEDGGSSIDDEIDAFLRKEGKLFAIPDDAPVPNNNILPSEAIQKACEALRRNRSSGAAIFLGFCLPLTNNEKLSGTNDAFKELIRASITPKIFSKRIRASPFSVLLDWKTMSVTEGYYQLDSVAFVNAALFFEDGAEPVIVQFRLRRSNGLWLIDRASRSKKELFLNNESDEGVNLI
mmetsp:Transcript_14141/g.21720  ORF Transcript_14141/g.21720 Transcript_14141/m.21720 type:complete len:266 (+) Transcript_14141:134-931(+)